MKDIISVKNYLEYLYEKYPKNLVQIGIYIFREGEWNCLR